VSVTGALNDLARSYGIVAEFHDLSGALRPTSPDTVKALLRANGVEVDNDAMIRDALAERRMQEARRSLPQDLIIARGEPTSLGIAGTTSWQLTLESETDIALEGGHSDILTLPPLPGGLHSLTLTHGGGSEIVTLIAAPKAAPSIGESTGLDRLWGLNAALYGLRSDLNLGLGNFDDLARLAEIAARNGASFIGVNPVHATGWAETATISPYSPSHRGYLNTAHIAADRIPGLQDVAGAHDLLQQAAAGFAAAKASDTVDHEGHAAAFRTLLRRVFALFETAAEPVAMADFASFCAAGGESLRTFTEYEALSEENGPDWRTWPAGPAQPKPGRAHFHGWLQWVASMQLDMAQSRAQKAGMPLGLYLDLAVGPRRGGAETWCEGDSIAKGVSLGAPPDHLGPAGQNWNLAAYAPEKQRQTRYRALRRILRENMRHAGLMRIDHVLGMNRSYWIPDDGSPGGYVRQPVESLLAVVAIEAERAGTVIVGEDLGLVPDGFRDTLNRRGLYSYSVLQYEMDNDGRFRRPGDLRPQSLACFGTHDTPTIQGFWSGRDIDWWQHLGWIDGDVASAARERREREKRDLLSIPVDMTARCGTDPVTHVHRLLAASPVAMVSVQLDDVLEVVEAQNLPGTIDEHPNWRRRCPLSLGEIGDGQVLSGVGRIMADAGRARSPRERRKDSA